MSAMQLISITNSKGMTLEVLNYGASILSLKVPDKHGKLTNVVAGLISPQAYAEKPYLDNSICLGASVGRYAGRISKGSFSIEKTDYPLYHEDGVHLHGGKTGFDKKYWTLEKADHALNPSITLSYFSKDMEEGYPGNLQASVTYQLKEDNTLKITYKANTDKTTVVNLTNHAYFNLNGEGSVLDHQLKINSHQNLEVHENLIPTGKILNSTAGRFDFNTLSKINRADFTGFDDTFILDADQDLKAQLISEKTGLKMSVYTNQPAMVVYTPKVFSEALSFYENAEYKNYPAICFETQNYPDAPNNAHFPSAILAPGDDYINQTEFKFTTVS